MQGLSLFLRGTGVVTNVRRDYRLDGIIAGDYHFLAAALTPPVRAGQEVVGIDIRLPR